MTSRRQFLQGSSSIAAASAAPLNAISLDALFSSDTLSPLTTASTDRFDAGRDAWGARVDRALSRPRGQRGHAQGDCHRVAGDADDRDLVSEHDTLNMVTLSAPRDAIGTRLRDRAFGNGLQSLDAVESIDLVVRLQHPEPVSLDDADVAGYDLGGFQSFSQNIANVDTPDWSGLAFSEDAKKATLQESRQLCRADASVLDGVDTSPVTVAVIDSGVVPDSYLDDANGNTRLLDASTNLRTGETVGADGTDAVLADDSSEHGGWVARCIAARDSAGTYRGFADAADVLAAKVLGSDGSGNTDDIVAGVELAIDEGADVACMSLGESGCGTTRSRTRSRRLSRTTCSWWSRRATVATRRRSSPVRPTRRTASASTPRTSPKAASETTHAWRTSATSGRTAAPPTSRKARRTAPNPRFSRRAWPSTLAGRSRARAWPRPTSRAPRRCFGHPNPAFRSKTANVGSTRRDGPPAAQRGRHGGRALARPAGGARQRQTRRRPGGRSERRRGDAGCVQRMVLGRTGRATGGVFN